MIPNNLHSPSMSDIESQSIDEVRKQMFLDFCKALDDQGVPYVILAGHISYPEQILSDVDFMVAEEDFHKLPAILGKPSTLQGAKIIQIVQHESTARNYAIAKQSNSKMVYLQLDFAAEFRLDARLWLANENVLQTRRRSKSGFWIPAAASEFEYYYVKRVEKKALEARHIERLSALWNEDAVGCRNALEKFTSVTQCDLVAKAIQGRDLGWFSQNINALQREMLRSIPIESIGGRIKSKVSELLRLLDRVAQPTGLIIAILGPDGCGKTTVIKHISEEFIPPFRRLRYFHLRPNFGRIADNKVEHAPHSKAPRSGFSSFLKIGVFVADYWISWLKFVLPAKIRSSLVIFDRYYHDMLVDQRRYRLPSGFLPARLLAPLIPKPDIWLILNARPEQLVARKGEISLDDAARLNAGYLELARTLDNAFVIDASTSLDETLNSVVTTIRGQLERRAERQLQALA